MKRLLLLCLSAAFLIILSCDIKTEEKNTYEKTEHVRRQNLNAIKLVNGLVAQEDNKDTLIANENNENKIKIIENESLDDNEYELYELTAYTNGYESTGKRPGDKDYGKTASGVRTKEGVTIAADWNKLPLGTKVWIEGVGERTVQDVGGAIKGNKIDVFFEDLDEAKKFGRKKNVKVKVISKPGE